MNYFKINNTDYSQYVNSLKVNRKNIYNSQTNAAGDTVADLVNAKRTIEVGIIPLSGEAMASLLKDIESFNVSVSFLNPRTNSIEENVNCIIPSSGVDYYTIQAGKTLLNAFSVTIEEL